MGLFQVAVLASGSKGNSVVVRTMHTSLLVDAGVSRKRIFDALQQLSLQPSQLSAILVSHEHSDHIGGIPVIAKQVHTPVHMTEPTWRACASRLGPLAAEVVHFCPGTAFTVGDIVVTPFSASHDAVDGCHFLLAPVDQPERRLAVVTDAGFLTNLLVTKLHGVSTLVLESNHDLRMLMDGPYPWDLKQRIRGRQGHLSNDQAVGLIGQIMHPGLRNLILAHLSEINNTPELARATMRQYLDEVRLDTGLYIASQYESTPLIEV